MAQPTLTCFVQTTFVALTSTTISHRRPKCSPPFSLNSPTLRSPPMLDPTDSAFVMTLEQIRTKSPCESGWKKLLTYLDYSNGSFDPKHEVSLGDVAFACGASDAFWCLQVLDWMNIELRRTILGRLILPLISKASELPQKSLDCCLQLDLWCQGDSSINLLQVRRDASASAASAYAASASTYAASASTYANAAAKAAANAAA